VIAVILQPSYIPWRGTFDQIRRADTFVFYDDVQYDKHGWRIGNQDRQRQTIADHPVRAGVRRRIPSQYVSVEQDLAEEPSEGVDNDLQRGTVLQ
jgi:hypothetical protein